MLVDIPCVLYIDTEQYLPHAQAVQKCALTLRFDTEDNGVPFRFCTHYPPKPDAKFWDDTGDVFTMALGTREYHRLIARARANPYDYAVGTEEERTRMQDAVDAAREPRE